jgi:hypothetical protein
MHRNALFHATKSSYCERSDLVSPVGEPLTVRGFQPPKIVKRGAHHRPEEC